METSHLLLNVPAEIATERLHLRSPRFGDGALILDNVRASLPELKPWLPWASDDYGLDDAELWCRRVAARFLRREEFPFLMFTQDGLHIGNIGLFQIAWSVPKVEIGYWLATAHHGHGYMTDAVRGVCEFARTHLSAIRIEIRTDSENVRSRRVAERCGFQLDGILPAYGRGRAGELRDECIYSAVHRGQ